MRTQIEKRVRVQTIKINNHGIKNGKSSHRKII